jgi:hypothetical protein
VKTCSERSEYLHSDRQVILDGLFESLDKGVKEFLSFSLLLFDLVSQQNNILLEVVFEFIGLDNFVSFKGGIICLLVMF